MKYKRDIKTSGDFDNDPQAAIDALEKTGFAIFMITKGWYGDLRAQKEWRFARDMKKPMVYILSESGRAAFRNDMFVDTLIGTINDYGNTAKTGNYLEAIISAFEYNLDKT